MPSHTKRLVVIILLLLVVFICCTNTEELRPGAGDQKAAVALALTDSREVISTEAWTSIQPDIVRDRYIVMLNPKADPDSVAQSHALKPSAIYKHAIKGFAATIPRSALQGISKNPNILSLTPIRLVQAFGQQVPTGVRRMGGPVSKSVDVGIAIIDTGIKQGHGDLNVVARTDCSSSEKKNRVCIDGSGDDAYGHGTHVAGIAAAIDNDSDVVGVAAGAPLYSVKVLDDQGSGTIETVIKGLDWVAARTDRIRVANLSFGGACSKNQGLVECDDVPCDSTKDAEHKAICNLVASGVTVVVAAGNNAMPTSYFAPAAYDEVITVSALADFDGAPGGNGVGDYSFAGCTESEDDSFACFSNNGIDVDLIAPGVGILSTTPDGLASWSGTSMAAPHVTGAAALYLADNPGATPTQVREALVAAADPTPCAETTASGFCADDPDRDMPDGVAEPLVRLRASTCASGADCDDANPCNGQEVCDPAVGCQPGEPISCDDVNLCTVDICNPASGACDYPSVDCDDADPCTEDWCDASSGCVHEYLCECATKGSSCTNNAECCSNKCARGMCRGN